jgi:nicotinamidase-related amidase
VRAAAASGIETPESPLGKDTVESGVTQVVIGGIATSMGVESTARAAHEHGYNVTIATDAITDPDPPAHTHSLKRVFPKLGERGTTQEILSQLARQPANQA